jgi:SAM-dependent methyltransferase
MSWRDLTRSFRAVRESEPGSPESEGAWNRFSGLVQESASKPPYHIRLLLDRLEAYREDRPREEVVILDHGCGGALTLFYIGALGYTNFWGLDVDGDYVSRNAIARKKFGHKEDRLSAYDGRAIPLSDSSVDFVFSQQVIEHLDDSSVESYYREEGRVLKFGGIANHYVPHRLVPYDSHTRTWLIHYLPQPFYRSFARLLRSPVPDHLHLRWPWVHRNLVGKHIGPVEDATIGRFSIPPDEDSYDGSFMLRRIVTAVMGMPLFGPLARRILGNLVMLETVSAKR